MKKSKLKSQNLKIMWAILIALLMPLVAFADIYAAPGQDLEIRLPVRGSTVDRYYVTQAKDPKQIIEYGSLKRKDNNIRGSKLRSKTWLPGLYRLHYVSGEAAKQETIFIAPPVDYGSNKLSSVLRQSLYFADKQDRESLEYFAKSRGLLLRNETLMVDVELKINKKGRDRIISLISEAGGAFRFDSGAFMRAELPVSVLNNLVADNDLLFVYPIEPGDFDEATSQGVADTKANLWHLAGFDGKGIKVAIVDGGFQNYKQSIVSGDLPANLTTKSFSTDFESDTHGTNCSEIVYDMVPCAQIYLVSQGSDDIAGFKNIINYLISEEVNVVSHSMSEYRGPYNGASIFAKEINKARDAGIIWVNAAGNRAKTHWEGKFNNNGNNRHVWSGNDTKMKVDPVSAKFRLAWNDWGKNADGECSGNANGQDYALNIYKNGVLAETADTDQANNPNADPFEKISFANLANGDIIEVELIAKNNTGSGDYFEIFSHSSSNFEYEKPESSISIGGDAQGAIAVGAVDVVSHKIKDYSSQGPTNGIDSGPPDNTSLIKPDVGGPTNVKTSLDGNFGGTSAATPHVAGAAALVLQAIKEAKIDPAGNTIPDKVNAYFEKHTYKLGNNEKNNQSGNGLVVLDDQSITAGFEIPEADIVDYISPSAFPIGKGGYVFVYGKNLSDSTKINTGEGIEFFLLPNPSYYFSKELMEFKIAIDDNTQVGEKYLTFTDNFGKIDKVTFEAMGADASYIDLTGTSPVKSVGWSGEINVLKMGEEFFELDYKKNKPLDINFGEGIEVKKIKDAVNFDNVPVDIEIKPDAVPGPRTVTITNADGTKVIGKDAFLVLPSPEITDITPSCGGIGMVEFITIKLKNLFVETSALTDLDKISFGEGINVVEYIGVPFYGGVMYEIEISGEAKPGIRTVSILDKAFGTFEVLSSPTPTITNVLPKQLTQGQETPFKVFGMHLKDGFTLSFGNDIQVVPSEFWPTGYEFTNSAVVMAKVEVSNEATTGLRDVTIINPDGKSYTAKNIFEVLASPEPIIKSVSPVKLIQGYGSSFQVVGMNFKDGFTLSFGNDIQVVPSEFWPTGYEFMSSAVVMAKVEVSNEAMTGLRDVTIINPDGKSYTAKNIFEVSAKMSASSPKITAVAFRSPIKVGQEKEITIKGKNFEPDKTTVSFDSPLLSMKSIDAITKNEIKLTIYAKHPAYKLKEDKLVKIIVKTSQGTAEKENAIVIKAEGAK